MNPFICRRRVVSEVRSLQGCVLPRVLLVVGAKTRPRRSAGRVGTVGAVSGARWLVTHRHTLVDRATHRRT